MKHFAIILALFCISASQPPPMPPTPKSVKHWKHAIGVTQGAGALSLITPKSVALPAVYTFYWQYPAGLNPYDFWWNVESSTDLKNWSVIITNASGESTVNASKSDPLRVYRLSGRLKP